MLALHVALISASELVPSEWDGNYTCLADGFRTVFRMNITKSDTIDTVGSVSILGKQFSMSGAYAYAFRTLTLQSDQVISEEVAGRNFTNVELDGQVKSSVFIEGYVVFTDDSGDRVQCPVQLRRFAGKQEKEKKI